MITCVAGSWGLFILFVLSVSVAVASPASPPTKRLITQGIDPARTIELPGNVRPEAGELALRPRSGNFFKAIDYIQSTNALGTPLGGFDDAQINSAADRSVMSACGTSTSAGCQ